MLSWCCSTLLRLLHCGSSVLFIVLVLSCQDGLLHSDTSWASLSHWLVVGCLGRAAVVLVEAVRVVVLVVVTSSSPSLLFANRGCCLWYRAQMASFTLTLHGRISFAQARCWVVGIVLCGLRGLFELCCRGIDWSCSCCRVVGRNFIISFILACQWQMLCL